MATAGVMGERTSTDSGTTAPFSAINGISSLIRLLPSFIGRLPKRRFIAASTVSCWPSACSEALPRAGSTPVAATTQLEVRRPGVGWQPPPELLEISLHRATVQRTAGRSTPTRPWL